MGTSCLDDESFGRWRYQSHIRGGIWKMVMACIGERDRVFLETSISVDAGRRSLNTTTNICRSERTTIRRCVGRTKLETFVEKSPVWRMICSVGVTVTH